MITRHPFRTRIRDFRGFTLLSILMALLIIGILGGMYLSPSGGSVQADARGPFDKTERAACDSNRSAVAIRTTEYRLTHNHYPTLGELEKSGVSIPRCPGGGMYYLLDGKVYCTAHTQVAVSSPD